MRFRIGYTIMIVAVLLTAELPVRCQTGEPVASQYSESYDSLLNSFYLKRYKGGVKGSEWRAEEFDGLSDSVLGRRLRSLRTTVPMTMNSEVRRFIRFYLGHMSTRLDVMLTLSEFYGPMMEETLNRYGVPEELKYLSIVESAMNPRATSRVGAAGLWQFMYSTGKQYGMEVNSVVDERRDVYKSTVAAARYLRDLYGVFGDWTLAIAAYNCGPGNITKAMARSGGKRDFWEIYWKLPRETRGYIPAFIAVVYVMNYYELHGLHATRLNLPLRCDTVMVREEMLLCHVSEVTGVELEELRTLNPQYRKDFIPAREEGYSLCLPLTRVERFIGLEDSVARMTRDSLSRVKGSEFEVKSLPEGTRGGRGGGGRYYTVRKGDTLSKVARKHGMSVKELKRKNGLKRDEIRVGQRLKVR